MSSDSVALLITARDEQSRNLELSLRSALDQEVSGGVMLVDDQSSTPITTALSEVSTLRLERNAGISGARNAGLAALPPTRFVAVFNCDILLPDGWTTACSEYLDAHPECGAVWTGLRHALDSRASRWWLDCQELATPSRVGRTPFAPGHAVMFRREALDAVAGYDQQNFPNVDEDHDVCRRLAGSGFETHFIGDPFVVSLQDLSIREMARKDFTRMRIGGQAPTAQGWAVTRKAARRFGRHLLGRQWALIPRDLAVGVAGVLRAVQMSRRHARA